MYYIFEIGKDLAELIKVKDSNEALLKAKERVDKHGKSVRFYPSNPEKALSVNKPMELKQDFNNK